MIEVGLELDLEVMTPPGTPASQKGACGEPQLGPEFHLPGRAHPGAQQGMAPMVQFLPPPWQTCV